MNTQYKNALKDVNDMISKHEQDEAKKSYKLTEYLNLLFTNKRN